MKQLLFFALKEDILPLLEDVERKAPIKYVRTGQFSTAEYESFVHATEMPNLGTASADTSSSSETFLVTGCAVPINVRPVKLATGAEHYCIDQLVNPDSVAFTPGGIWDRDIVLCGRVATVSESVLSQELMKRFNSTLRKQFRKIKAFWVGPQAHVLLDAGKRLTISAQSPRSFDLTTVP
jgi:hypothetical protein